jgi:arylsulfatase
MKKTRQTILIFLLMGLCCFSMAAAEENSASRPNIVLLVADDLGYADLGSYGSDIETPHIDALAKEGVLFTQFHTAVMCAPTRSMLLSGNNNHVAGMARQSRRGILGREYPGYEAHLSDRIVPFPRLLRDAGYHTYMAGKWHLGRAVEHGPRAAGFERSFINVDGAGNHWDAVGFFEGGSVFREDAEDVKWPEGRYSTEFFTSKLIEYIESNRADGKPFFAFAAYTSPHWPLQVPEAELDRYAGRYDEGYDRLREINFQRLKAAGIVKKSMSLPPRNESVTPWRDLDDQQRRREARKMELYAAMVSNLDANVGRLVEYLKQNGLYENTLVVFMSDNGAAAGDFYNFREWEPYYSYLREHYDNSYENMGRPNSWVSYGTAWAEAGSAPFRRYKGYATEGGITAPMIIAGVAVASTGARSRAYSTVMDLAPTFLELAGVDYPASEEIQPMRGESMVPHLAGEAAQVHDENYVTVHSHGGRAYLRQGKWKLVNVDRPFDEARMALFDLESDPGETNNLAESEPEKYQGLLELWRSERKARGIVLPQDL